MGERIPEVEENRNMLLGFAEQKDMVLINTFFPKQEKYLATYKEDKQHTGGPPYNRSKYETLDYVLVEKRWRNSIQDAEAAPEEYLNTDHYPIKTEVKINLRGKVEPRKRRWEYRKCTEEE